MTTDLRVRLAGTVAGGALVIAVVTVISRVVGLGRWAIQASQVGSTGIGESYAVANLLPNVLFEVVAGGALAGAVVPVVAGAIARRDVQEASRSASAMLSWTLGALVPIGALVAIFAPQVIGALPRVDEPSLHQAAVALLRMFAVQVPLYGVSVVAAGILQAHRRFFWPAAAPILSTPVVIGSYLVFGALAHGDQTRPELLSSTALAWLGWGTTAGVVALSLPLLVPVYRTGVRLRPTFRFPPGQGRRARALALAGIGGLLAQQVSVVVLLVVATGHGAPGAYPVFQYAQAVYLLPYAVLAVPLATTTFPRLAEHAATGETEALSSLAAQSLRGVLLVAVAGAAALVAMARPVEVFFGFTAGGAHHMAVAVAWLAPGTIGFAALFHASRILYAAGRSRAAVFGAVCGWGLVSVVALAGAWLLVPGHDTAVVFRVMGAASSVGMMVGGGLLVAFVRRYLGPAAVAGTLRTVTIVAAVGAVACVVLWRVAALLAPAGSSVFQGAWAAALVAGLALGVVLVTGWFVDRAAVHALLRGKA